MNTDAQLVLGFLIGASLLPCTSLLLGLLHTSVEEGEVALISRFGKLSVVLLRPGWHWLWDRAMPWISIDRISLRRDRRNVEGIIVNDVQGTTVEVDVFLEFRIIHPVKARFAVSNWEQALTNVVSHAVISILGTLTLQEILADRTELRQRLEQEISEETERWGLRIERVFLRDVRLHPDLADFALRSVAAKLERWKADIEEEGRQRASLLEAETSAKIASLVAESRSQYPLALGRIYEKLADQPKVRDAYDVLYELSLLHPQRTVSFVGFAPGEIRTIDAAMMVPQEGG